MNAKKISLRSKIVDAHTISEKMKKEMFALFDAYYENVEYERFVNDLSEKTHVFLFYRGNEFVGFSTIFRKKLPHIAKGVFLYSGDTVLREDCWGSKILQKAFFRFIVESKIQSPHRPVYWMLISKGFKTYMMMRKNFKKSYPNFKNDTPLDFQSVMNGFYDGKFKNCYDKGTGLIRFERSLGAVKGGHADPDKVQLADPDVRYFLKRNPQYCEGVELACVAEIRFEDFISHIPKFFIKLGRKKKKFIKK